MNINTSNKKPLHIEATSNGAKLVMDTIPADDGGDATNASIDSAISLAGITPAIYYANESAVLSSFVNQFNASSATTNSVESGSAIVDYTFFLITVQIHQVH